METEEQIAQKAAEQFLAIKNGTESELAAIIRNAIEKANALFVIQQREQLKCGEIIDTAAQPQRSDRPDCKCVEQGYPEQDCKWHGAASSEPKSMYSAYDRNHLNEPDWKGSEPQEWTVHTVRALAGTSQNQSNVTGSGYQAIADAHKAALAAERERRKPLVEALENLIKVWNASDHNDDPKVIQKAIDKGNAALASVKEQP